MNETEYALYIAKLIAKQALGRVTESEDVEIRRWIEASKANRQTYEDLLDAAKQRDYFGHLRDKETDASFLRLRERYYRSTRARLVRLLPYAAAVLIAATAAVWIFIDNETNPKATDVNQKSEVIAPAGNRATLTLADGRTVTLNEGQEGIVIGEEITYLDGGDVLGSHKIQESKNRPERSEVYELQLTTPKGGTYKVSLADGTQVWLNAGSTLRYPNQFGETSRVVEFEGEGYFSVAKEENRPFKVISNGQQIQVLGTEFNLSAYKDESMIKTTLVKGRVSVESTVGNGESIVLVPGEQSRISNNGLSTKATVNLKKELAWKAGLFYFDETSFEELLRQVSRWYDIAVRYEGKMPQESFSGIMSRNVTLNTLLDYLSESTVAFELTDKTLVVKSTSR